MDRITSLEQDVLYERGQKDKNAQLLAAAEASAAAAAVAAAAALSTVEDKLVLQGLKVMSLEKRVDTLTANRDALLQQVQALGGQLQAGSGVASHNCESRAAWTGGCLACPVLHLPGLILACPGCD